MAMLSSIPALAVPVVLFLILWALCYKPLAGFIGLVKWSARSVSAWIGRSRAESWTADHAGKAGSYAPICILLLIGGLTALGAGYAFVELAEQVRQGNSAVNSADQAIRTWFGHERQPAVTVLLRIVTTLGGGIGMSAIVVLAAALLLVRKMRASAVFLAVTAAAGALLNLGLKMIFTRARPDLTLAIASATWYSFPSGHAMGSFICFGAMAYLALRQPWPWRAKSAVLAFANTMVILVGLSRVYLGVHWASDIAGGWSAGAVWLAFAVVAFEMLLRVRQRRRGATPTGPAVDVPDQPCPAPSAAS
jgi:undecaprenyl-diphosphatase